MIADGLSRSQIQQNTTFVCGYWHIADNVKRRLSEYAAHLPATLSLIRGGRLLFYHDSVEMLALVERHARQFDIELVSQRVEIAHLPTFATAKQLLLACKAMDAQTIESLSYYVREKAIQHYYRDYRQSGEESYVKAMTVWTSKIPIVADVAMSSNPFQTPNFCWIDISLGRVNKRRTNWDFINSNILNADFVCHYNSGMNYLGKNLPLSAGFLYGSADVWQKLNPSYLQALSEHQDDNYAHDEETILSFVVNSNPQLFKQIGTVTLSTTQKLMLEAAQIERSLVMTLCKLRPRNW